MGGSGRVIPDDPISVLRGIKERAAQDGIEVVESVGSTDSLAAAKRAMAKADLVS
jgi:hypothetical protein